MPKLDKTYYLCDVTTDEKDFIIHLQSCKLGGKHTTIALSRVPVKKKEGFLKIIYENVAPKYIFWFGNGDQEKQILEYYSEWIVSTLKSLFGLKN